MFFVVFGTICLGFGLALRAWARRLSGRMWRAGIGLLAGVSLLGATANGVGAGYAFWAAHRAQPEPLEETLYEGVTYVRDVREEPDALVIHIVSVDLDAEGVAFLVTPGQATDDGEALATRTTDFLDAFDLQVAVNGDFFSPWDPDDPRSYPGPGEPVDVKGLASSAGAVYSVGRPWQPTLYISPDNQAAFDAPNGDVYNAISGDHLFLQDGLYVARRGYRYHDQRHPRTVLALDRDATTLFIVVVDGRQPNYSEGISLSDLADILVDYGAYTAMNLDGGGSATLVAQDGDGRPLTLNSPIHSRIPGRERPVANHLGVYAQAPHPAAHLLNLR